jgi:predicted nucleic acid-binding protein
LSIYTDSSFFVSVYLPDSHTPAALGRLARKPRIWLTSFHETELVHAILQQVFRGVIASDRANRAIRGFRLDRDAGLWEVTDFPEAAFGTATGLAESSVTRLGTRTLDSLHVAAALEFKAERFWTFDERQAKLAKAAGLKVT